MPWRCDPLQQNAWVFLAGTFADALGRLEEQWRITPEGCQNRNCRRAYGAVIDEEMTAFMRNDDSVCF